MPARLEHTRRGGHRPLHDAAVRFPQTLVGSGQRTPDRAHCHYRTAIRTLAQMRRLLTPAVQINVSEQQVNVAG